AKRIELCCNLSEGGTTPSIGLLKVIKCNVSLPVFVMIRPRGGDFLYTEAEFEVMIEDCEQVINAGADGIVCGILTKQGEIDVPGCKKLLGIIKPLPVTFHRAFDMVPDQSAALEVIINLGFDRILTSGGKPDVLQGAPRLKDLVNQAGRRIIIMPGK
ncbi:copper homeostasis cutC homolog, partial [Paramuricea clavata]